MCHLSDEKLIFLNKLFFFIQKDKLADYLI